MTDKILVVTAPDDVQIDGIRLLVVNLNQEQSHVVSEALMKFKNPHLNIISYIWQFGNDIQWMIDKKLKSDIVIFNADCDNSELVTGFIAAQPNSYYFGTLKDLHKVNNRAIYNVDNILLLLEKIVDQHAK
jgi:hypothetical protein